MATYYVNAGGDFNASATGTSTTDPFTGPYGIKKAWDMCTDEVADTVYCTGTCVTKRLAKLTVGADKSATWSVGNEVRNNTGSGDDWTGVITKFLNDGGTYYIYVEVDNGYGYANIDAADGLENITQNDTATISTAEVDKMSVGPYKTIGCNASFVVDKTRFIFDGSGCEYALYAASSMKLFYIHAKNATNDGLICLDYCFTCFLYMCKFTNNGRYGLYNRLERSVVIGCNFDYNSSHGKYYRTYYEATVFYACTFNYNSGAGNACIYPHEVYVNCIAIGNFGSGFYCYHAATYSGKFFNCIADGNGSYGISATYMDIAVNFCRITNNTTGALYAGSYPEIKRLFYNYIFGNGSGLPSGILDLGYNKTDGTSDGYTNALNDEYNLANDADYRNIEIEMI